LIRSRALTLVRRQPIALLALFVALGGTSFAAEWSGDRSQDVFHGCIADRSGRLRIVDPAHRCSTHEKPISFNREGRRGPQGAAGKPGPAGDAGMTGATGERGPAGMDINASNHYTKAETDARYLAATGKAADADKLDGADLADLAISGDLLFARVASNGTTISGSRPAGVTAVALTANASRVTFARNIAGCAFSAIEADGSPSGETIAVAPAGGGSVDITFQTTLHAFHLQVIC
jgi:hypothetical protein